MGTVFGEESPAPVMLHQVFNRQPTGPSDVLVDPTMSQVNYSPNVRMFFRLQTTSSLSTCLLSLIPTLTAMKLEDNYASKDYRIV